MSSHSSHHPREVPMTQFSLHVHKGGLRPHSFHFVRMVTGPKGENSKNGDGGQLIQYQHQSNTGPMLG